MKTINEILSIPLNKKYKYDFKVFVELDDCTQDLYQFLHESNIDINIIEENIDLYEINHNCDLYMTLGDIYFQYKNEIFLYTGTKHPDIKTSYISLLCSTNKEILIDFINYFMNHETHLDDTINIFDTKWVKINNKEKNEFRKYNWDSIILDEKIKNEIITETSNFINGNLKHIYNKLNLPYKRGFIFIGPPGCGKTLTSKIIASTFNVPFIYVKSISGNASFTSIYKKASLNAPSIVLLEDIDTLINYGNRTLFLNILDGIEEYNGVLTIATSNNPHKIDPALLNRPSRFDKKWIFAPPTVELKIQYIKSKLNLLYEQNKINEIEKEINQIANNTKYFSFANLQELIIYAAFLHDYENISLNQALNKAFNAMKEQIDISNPNNIIAQMYDKPNTIGFLIGKDKLKNNREDYDDFEFDV